MDGLIGQAQHLAHSERGQRIVDAELAGHIHLDVHIVLAGDMELDAEEVMGAEQLVSTGAVVGLLAAAVGHQLAGVAFQQGLSVLVVDVHDAGGAALEKLTLPAAVFFKGLVLAGADVVGREVGEDADVVMDVRHAVHHEALTGHFHQRRIAAGVQKLPESLLQLVALRGGVGRLLMVAEEVDAVGADHAHFAACGFQHALYHVGGGGLGPWYR